MAADGFRPTMPLAVIHSFSSIAEGLGPAQTYARFREEVAARDIYEIDGVEEARFHFAWDAVVMSDASLVGFDAIGMKYTRDAARIRADGLEDIRIQLTHRGGFRGRLGTQDVAVGAGTAVFVDQTMPFLNESLDTRGRTIALPRRAFGQTDVQTLHGRVVSGAAFARLNDYFTWLASALPGARASARDRVLAAMGAVVRATFEPSGEAELQDSGALDGTAVARLRAIAVDPGRSAGRTTDELARAVGVSRSALYRATAPLGGVMEVVWSARLEAARASLNDPFRSGAVGEIALAFGFADASHFQRRFRDRFGFNPGDLRPIRPSRRP